VIELGVERWDFESQQELQLFFRCLFQTDYGTYPVCCLMKLKGTVREAKP